VSATWSNKRALVTGGSGLVGSALVRDLLARGADVTVLMLEPDPQSEFVRSGASDLVSVAGGAVQDLGTMQRVVAQHAPDIVFHLAAQTQVGAAIRAPFQTFEANIRGTYTVLEACRTVDPGIEAIVVASSDKAYGAHDQLPYVETMRLDGIYPYDVSKSCTDLITRSYAVTYGLPVVTARCGNIFGPGDLNWDRIVPGTIRSVVERRQPLIRSDGTPTRDYIFVDDVSSAYLSLAEQVSDPEVRGSAFNFSLDQPVAVLQMVAQIHEVMGVDDLTPQIQATARAEISHQFLSSERARSVLGWVPAFDIEAGLRATIPWYETFLEERRSRAS